MNDLVQEVTKKLGPMARVAKKATYNPRTKKFYGFPESYAPDPVQYRKSFLRADRGEPQHLGGRPQGSAEAQGDRAPGRSRHVERDRLEHAPDFAPLLLRRLHPERGRTRSSSARAPTGRARSRRCKLMRDIYKNGMSDEVFAWTAASNNQAFLAGRLSMALNAISIERSAEQSGNQALSDDSWLAPIPRGPAHAHGERARHGRVRHLEVREEQGGSAEVPRRPAAGLPRTLRAEPVLQLPAPGRERSKAGSRPSASWPPPTRTSPRASTRS